MLNTYLIRFWPLWNTTMVGIDGFNSTTFLYGNVRFVKKIVMAKLKPSCLFGYVYWLVLSYTWASDLRHSCQYRTICDTYHTIRIISCGKCFVSYWHIVSSHESYDIVCISYESYHIVKSCMNRIVSYYKIVCIIRYIDKCFKIRFFVKICTFIWI